jgi:hypothetical protein
MAIPISALALSDFEDATHGNRYEEGRAYGLDKGLFANFEAAGLMRKLTDAEIAKLPHDGDIAPPAKPESVKPTRTAKRPRAAKK